MTSIILRDSPHEKTLLPYNMSIRLRHNTDCKRMLNTKKPQITAKIKTPDPIINIKPVQKAPIKVSIAALQEFDALFDTHQYSRESWENGKRKLPRITFEKMTDNWQKDSRNLPVEAKKLFFTPDGTPYFNGQ
ncbi:MAG: hypothetical protein ACI8UC_001603 [Psychromonas sp.]|jgi:hypothetical protein